MGSDSWPLLLRTGFGNVLACGRWGHEGAVLIADAINSGKKKDWALVEAYARGIPWEPDQAC